MMHDIINYPVFIYPIESGKCGKKGKKYKTFQIKFVFEGLSFGGKINTSGQKP